MARPGRLGVSGEVHIISVHNHTALNLVNINNPHPPFFRMCGKQRTFKSFRFGSVANARVTGGFFGCVARKGLRCVSGSLKVGTSKGGSKPLALKPLRESNSARVGGEGCAIIMAQDTREVN